MFADLILGIAAGAGAPYAETYIKTALESVLLADAPLTEMELRLFAFAICLVGAAILAVIFGEGTAFGLAAGGAIGVFAPRIIDRVQKRRSPDYGSDPNEE
jgi:hypothetical protein